MKAIQIEAFGTPADVVKSVDVTDVGAPAAGEVVIALEGSPVNLGGDVVLVDGPDLTKRVAAETENARAQSKATRRLRSSRDK